MTLNVEKSLFFSLILSYDHYRSRTAIILDCIVPSLNFYCLFLYSSSYWLTFIQYHHRLRKLFDLHNYCSICFILAVSVAL